MKINIERIRRAIWIYKQPLTRLPAELGYPISDLFIWRKSEDWSTYFELIDISGLFLENSEDNHAQFIFFDADGKKLKEEKIFIKKNQKNTIDISNLLKNHREKFGTFCIFHSSTPEKVKKLKSFIAERGYISYRYNNAPIKSYVHGNFDAVCLQANKKIELLGNQGILNRHYRIQHQFLGESSYELYMINPTRKTVKIDCVLTNFDNDKSKSIFFTKTLSAGGATFFYLEKDISPAYNVVMRSKMIMPRPVVGKFTDNNFDIFHG